jgi:hypothetical protein
MNHEKPRPESSNGAPAEPDYVCAVCLTHSVSRGWAGYNDEAIHVATDSHLEAMAVETVREWAAMPPLDPVSVGIAKQIARMEVSYGFDDWRRAMGLPDDAATLVISRRISAVWIKAIGLPDYEERMAYARKLIEIEQGMEKGDTT